MKKEGFFNVTPEEQEPPIKRQIKMTASEFGELKEMVEYRLAEYKEELEFFRKQGAVPVVKIFKKRFIPRYERMIKELTIK